MAQENFAGITYRYDLKAWWPDYDHDPVKCKSFVDHGLLAIDAAMRYVPGNRLQLAVQAGGHAGFWPLALADLFSHVITFEPERALFECLRRNCARPNVMPWCKGLGFEDGRANFKDHVSAGSWRVDPAGKHEIDVVALDSMELPALDALFLDIEGYEPQALRGAAKSIEKHKPAVILCELLPRSQAEIVRTLQKLKYRQADRYGRDGIFVPN